MEAMATPMFRSVLPHEPPLPADTLLGYLLVGALSPTKLDREAPVDHPSSYDYWAEYRDAFATSLHQQLASVLGDPTCNLVQPTLLLDPTPPYTKFRLFFSSLTAACTAATLLRRLSPSQLCAQQSSPYLVATAERPFHVTKLKERIREMADKLIRIAAERALRKAPVLEPPPGMWDAFSARFSYQETDDQL